MRDEDKAGTLGDISALLLSLCWTRSLSTPGAAEKGQLPTALPNRPVLRYIIYEPNEAKVILQMPCMRTAVMSDC